MTMTEKLQLTKPHIRLVKGVWCVYFSNNPHAKNWAAWAYVNGLCNNNAHYYHASDASGLTA